MTRTTKGPRRVEARVRSQGAGTAQPYQPATQALPEIKESPVAQDGVNARFPKVEPAAGEDEDGEVVTDSYAKGKNKEGKTVLSTRP